MHARCVMSARVSLIFVLSSSSALNSLNTCEHPHGPDDISYQGCFGWCSVAQAADHCAWCKVFIYAPACAQQLHLGRMLHQGRASWT